MHGRLSTEEWQADDGPRTSLVVEASAVGHDLTFGTSRFARTVSTGADAADGEPGADADGTTRAPVDVTGFVEAGDDFVPGEDVDDDGPGVVSGRVDGPLAPVVVA